LYHNTKCKYKNKEENLLTVGIICEYNPFHNGHLYQIKKVREIFGENCGIVAVMSGSFVQRGEGAIMDKWSRTKAAILAGGVNVVIELPALYATSSAEYFAKGAVACVEATGVCDYLVFGSETSDIEGLKKTARLLCTESDEYKTLLKMNLDTGISYPAAVIKSLSSYDSSLDPENILSGSNNILAVEYIKSIYRNKDSKLKPYSIKRSGQNYLDNSIPLSNEFRSASSIRTQLKDSNISASKILMSLYNSMPEKSLSILMDDYKSGKCILTQEIFSGFILTNLISSSEKAISDIPGMGEGLGNRLRHIAAKSGFKKTLLEDLIEKASTRRFPRSRINRALTHMMLGITNDDINYLRSSEGPCYLRVLGFDKKGQYILKKMRKSATLPIFMKGSDFLEPSVHPYLKRMAGIDCAATDIRQIHTTGECGLDFKTPPIAFPKLPRQ